MNKFRITIRNRQTGYTLNQDVEVQTFAEAASKAYITKAGCQQGNLPDGVTHVWESEWEITAINRLWGIRIN